MSHISKIFEEAPIKVQNRNGFDLSHTHSGSSKTGQLVPVLTKLIAPNSTISLGVQADVSMPPLVAPFYGKVDFAIEGFITPLSILYGGWKQFITNNDSSNYPATQSALLTDANNATVTVDKAVSDFGKSGYKLPYALVNDVLNGTLSDFTTKDATNDNIYGFMGCNITFSGNPGYTTKLSLLPGLCYHRICDVFYRNTKLTNTWFEVNPNWEFVTPAVVASGGYFAKKNVSLIWHSWYTDEQYNLTGTPGTVNGVSGSAKFSDNTSLTFPDGTSFWSTRQRPWSRDYFTSAVASPQQGGASTLKFAVDVSTAGSEFGTFTINSLRMANSLQKFLETNNLSGEYADMMRNRWGVRPIDADFDEPHYLGRVVVPVYQHTLSMTNQQEQQWVPSSSKVNPYVSDGFLGAQVSQGRANAEGSICDNFNVSCWSYLMVIASLVPHANYNYGLNRELTMCNLGDFPAPELQSVGMEEIKNYELCGSIVTPPTTYEGTFGYIPRFSRFKYVDDHTSGELRPGKTLSMFQVQRAIAGVPSLGTNFVTIAQSALDNVLSVATSTMNLSCWWEIYFKLHVVMPLADFCIPTLGELGDTHTIKTKVGGSRL